MKDAAEGGLRPAVGGAFFDLSSQCLTPLVGGRGGGTVGRGRDGGRPRSDVVQARRAGAGSGIASQVGGGFRGARFFGGLGALFLSVERSFLCLVCRLVFKLSTRHAGISGLFLFQGLGGRSSASASASAFLRTR